MKVVKEGQILIQPDGDVLVTEFEVEAAHGLHELSELAEERILLAADKIRQRRLADAKLG